MLELRPIFQVATIRAGPKIHIINEPLEGSAMFLVETGESRTLPETQAQYPESLRNWLVASL